MQILCEFKDPVIAAMKWSKRQNKKLNGKTRKCGKCGQPGHTSKTCHARVQNNEHLLFKIMKFQWHSLPIS